MENREVTIATIEDIKKAWSQEQIDTIRKTVAVNATPEELNMFLSLAYSYQLDPFAHEIWFVNMEGRNTIITGRDGYLKIANRNVHYKGMQSDVVYSGDKFMKDERGIHHAYNAANRGQIIGAYAEVYRDDRVKPAYCYAPMKDYTRNSRVWRQYPHTMIQKVAEAMALKRAFSISGLVTDDEIGYHGTVNLEMAERQPEPQAGIAEAIMQNKQTLAGGGQINPRVVLWQRYVIECNGNKEEAVKLIKSLIGDKPSKDWSEEDIMTLRNYLETFEDLPTLSEKQKEEDNKQEAAPSSEVEEITEDTEQKIADRWDPIL